jgi:hypothetical protein
VETSTRKHKILSEEFVKKTKELEATIELL